MMDNLKTSLLFRMLDLLLRVLAWRSAPKVEGESSAFKKIWNQVDFCREKFRKSLEQGMDKVGQTLLWRGPDLGEEAESEAVLHAPLLPQENLMTLSPQLVVKALTKAPLVDLLQIFSDCTLDEREHILSALRSAPLLGPDPKLAVSAPILSKDSNAFEIKGASLADVDAREIPSLWHKGESNSSPRVEANASISGSPPGALSVSPRTLDQPPDTGWDDVDPFARLLSPLPKPMSDYESGMGIDRDSFLRWVDVEQKTEPLQNDEWLSPLPLFEDLPKAPPSRELRSFVMGRDDWTETDETRAVVTAPPRAMPEDVSLPMTAPPDDLPPRVLRSLPPDLPVDRSAVQTLRERPQDWDEFQPLYSELNMIRKRFRDPDPLSPPLHRVGASPNLVPHSGWLTKSGPPPGGARESYTPPWSSPGRGSPPGRYSSGGPPPVPIPRRGRRLSSPKSRNRRDSGSLAERQISGPG